MRRDSITNWFELSDQDRQEIFTEVANRKELPIAAVEKDWWVVQALAVIFSMECASALIFKGGTSLSKGWNLIQRFSEDIDLVLDRAFLGFTGELSRGDIRKLRRKSFQFISENFTEELKNKSAEWGFKDLIVKCREVESHDQDPLVIEIYYPSISEKTSYLKPVVLVEVGSRSLYEPFTHRTFGTILSEVFTERPFSDEPITIPVVNPERTFLEKIFLLHEEFQKDTGKIRVDRLSRHLYDIEKLMQTKYAEIALQDTNLYSTIVKHRSKFTPISGIDYNNHSADKINIIPPDNIIKDWELDYQGMTQTMIYGELLSFDELINQLKKLQKRINAMS